jgi:protein required for attachment to host cells
MRSVCVLVCDAAKGRLFEARDGASGWTLLETMAHDESRARASELGSDRPGSRSSEGASVHHDALAPASTPKEVEKEHFAHSLAGRLDHRSRSGHLEAWVLVAPPHFVGLIKKSLTPELAKRLMATVDNDLTGLDERALALRLREVTRIPPDKQDVVRPPYRNPH